MIHQFDFSHGATNNDYENITKRLNIKPMDGKEDGICLILGLLCIKV